METSFTPSVSSISTTDFSSGTLEKPSLYSFNSLDSDIQNKCSVKLPKDYIASKVLLLKGVPDDVNEREILEICRPYGTIKDILLTRHKRYAFVQFSVLDEAIKCYQAFSETKPVLNDYTLYVFYTGKEGIVKPHSLSNPPSRFLLLTFNKNAPEIDSEIFLQLLEPFGKCNKVEIIQTNTTMVFIEMEDVLQAFQVIEGLNGKDMPDSLQIRVSFAKERPPSLSEASEQRPLHNYKTFLSTNKSMQMPLELEPYNIYNKVDRYSIYQQHSPPYEDYPSYIPRQTQFMGTNLPMNEGKPHNTLIVKNLPHGMTAHKLFKLFGMYGNVLKIKIFYKNPETALVEYQDYMQANLAKRNLNNCPLFGKNIFVTTSKQGIVIDNRISKKDGETSLSGDYSSSTEHRYKFAGSKNHCNIAPLSKVLHLSNLWEDKGEDFYKELFKEYGRIVKFMFLKGKDKMALVEMESIAEAVNILVDFHNYDIQGKFLKVSFSKYQKVQEPK